MPVSRFLFTKDGQGLAIELSDHDSDTLLDRSAGVRVLVAELYD